MEHTITTELLHNIIDGKVETIDLSNKNLTLKDFEYLFGAINESEKKPKEIILDSCKINNELLSDIHLAVILGKFNNKTTESKKAEIKSPGYDNYATIKQNGIIISLKNTAVTCNISAEFLEQVRDGTITEVKISEKKLNFYDLTELAEAINSENSKVSIIDLKSCSLDDCAITHFCEIFLQKFTRELNLHLNFEQADELYEDGEKLNKLYEMRNRITDIGARKIAELAKYVVIDSLSITHNDLTRQGENLLCKYIKNGNIKTNATYDEKEALNRNYTKHLSYNMSNEEVTQASLQEAFGIFSSQKTTNKSYHTLNLSRCKIDEQSLQKLFDLIKNSEHNLVEIDLSHSQIDIDSETTKTLFKNFIKNEEGNAAVKSITLNLAGIKMSPRTAIDLELSSLQREEDEELVGATVIVDEDEYSKKSFDKESIEYFGSGAVHEISFFNESINPYQLLIQLASVAHNPESKLTKINLINCSGLTDDDINLFKELTQNKITINTIETIKKENFQKLLTGA